MMKSTIYRYICSIALVAFAAVSGSALKAQTLPSLLLVQDPVSMSMGSAGVAAKSGAFALQNNVAAIALSDEVMAVQVGGLLWQPSYASIKTVGLGAKYRLGHKLGVGVEFGMLKMTEYDSFSPGDIEFAAGASYAITRFLSLGATLRYMNSSLAPEVSATVLGADLGAYFRLGGLSAGVSVNNIGTKVSYGETSYPQPALVKAGAGYQLKLGSSAVEVLAEADVLLSGDVMAGAGCEYSFKDMVFVRGGYHYGQGAGAVPSHVSAGVGFKFLGASLNLAYVFGSEILANSACLSLGYAF